MPCCVMLCSADVQIIVTHDQEEAFDLADKVVIFNRGLIEQVGGGAGGGDIQHGSLNHELINKGLRVTGGC